MLLSLLSACGPIDEPGPDPQKDNCESDCKELEKTGYPYSKCLEECRP
jgi:hypothetical protein